MDSKKIKILGVAFVCFFCLVAGLFYYASTKLRPDEIRSMVISQTQKIFPKAKVELKNVDVSMGLHFKVNLEKFKIDANPNGAIVPMFSVEHLVVNIPLWALLTNGGQVEIKLEGPSLFYSEFPGDANNWTYALDKKLSDVKSDDKEKSKKDEKDAPEPGSIDSSGSRLLKKSKINIKLSDINLMYALRDNSKGSLKISKFLIKGMNLESPTAFEIQSMAQFLMKDQSKISFDTLVIGQFNIADLLNNGLITSNVNIKVNNISKSGLDIKFPEIITNLEVLLKKDGELSGKFNTGFDSQNKLTASFKMAKNIQVSDVNVDVSLKDLWALSGMEKLLDVSKAKLIAKGELTYSSDKKIHPNFTFSIGPGIVYSKDGIQASTSMNGDLNGKIFSIKSKTELMEGVINSSIAGELDLNQKIDLLKLPPTEVRVSANGMKIPEKLIRSKLWEKKPAEIDAESGDEKSKEKEKNSKDDKKETDFNLPPTNVIVDWSNITVGGEDFSGKGRIVTFGKTLAIDGLGFKFSKGTGKLTQTIVVGKKSNDSKFNFEIQNLNLNSFKAFLPPFVENFTGNFSGKVVGTASMAKDEKMPNYDVSVQVNANKGEIKQLNIGDFINPLLANIPMVKDQAKDKQIKVDGNFETLSLKGNFTNSKYILSSFEFIGLDKKVQVTGGGEIYPISNKNQSIVDAVFSDGGGKISDLLMKNTGSKTLPLHLVGTGFALRPDYAFTIGKLAKGALKTKGEEKLKEAVQKNIDKYVPEKAKEKVKGLLNGLFKR